MMSHNDSMYVGLNYINGDFCPNRPDFSKYNPSTGETVGVFPNSNPREVMEAVSAAKEAQKKWRAVSRVVRAEYFDKLCDLIKIRLAYIADQISLETGKSLNESKAEVVEALHMTQYTFGMGRMPCGDVVSSEIAAKDAYVLRKPKGVVGVVAPWNFPFAIGGFWTSAPAILEGNCVVFKPSEDTPIVGQTIASLYDAAGFPPGVFNLIHGDGETGAWLVQHSDVNHICFTGSAEVGMKIRKVCAGTWHKSCSCEMGSKSAVIVFDDADMELALSACIASAFKLSGQRCVSSGRLLIQRKVYDDFCAKFTDLARSITVGDPFDEPAPFMGPLINRRQMEHVQLQNEKTKEFPGHIEVLMEGKQLERPGYYLTPHVYKVKKWHVLDLLDSVGKPHPVFLRQEVFGPHVALIPFDTLDEAIDIYNDTDYGLALGVVTSDFKKARECRDRCEFGLGYWNSGSIAAESHLPFGGVKKSGSGGGSAAATFKAVTNEVTWTVNHGPLAFPQGLK